MANIVNLPYVLVLDTTADNIVAAGVGVRIRKVRLVNVDAAACSYIIGEAGYTTGKIGLSAAPNDSDTMEFYAAPFVLAGLKITKTGGGAGSILYVYTEQA